GCSGCRHGVMAADGALARHCERRGNGIALCVQRPRAALGQGQENELFRKLGGKPSTTMLRHRDARFDAGAKTSWCHFVGGRVKEKPPTAEAEGAEPEAADAFYERCGDWLREHTRDHRKFKLIFE